MKPFDLEKALAGEPVVLRSGKKAYIKFKLENVADVRDALNGYFIGKFDLNNAMSWTIEGKSNYGSDDNNEDIIGMWQAPRPRVQLDLPATLEKVEEGQEVYYLELGIQFGEIKKFNFNEDNPYAFQLYKNGGLFATKEDAQEWLDAMRNARR